jgi:hypothetical protein
MPQYRMNDFKHLFRALSAGCPPHAGLAIGFDRLVAVMQGRDSVRDVIAFPKNSNGEDPMVESPGPMHRKQLEAYHLKIAAQDRLDFPKEQQHTKHVNMREQQKEKQGTKEETGKKTLETQTSSDQREYFIEYLDLLKVLPSDRSEATIKSFTPTERNDIQAYMEHLRVLPRERTALVPWNQTKRSMILIGRPIDTANNHRQMDEAAKKLSQLQIPAAVMVDSSDALKTYTLQIVTPGLKFLWQNPDMIANWQVLIHEGLGLTGEAILLALNLEKETSAEEGRNKTSLPIEKLDEVSGATKAEDKVEERPSDPGRLADAAQSRR